MLLAFGLVFEMPIVVLLLTKIGLITPDKMKKFRKFAILCSFILSAILTPPD
ncbi:MAG: twin-arginine translocase subunit TatC, partial [Deltaproteobacteria bacterium]|nr:twin-arginine translocase subunit TatC [Deltaproteobacteria bacterium]